MADGKRKFLEEFHDLIEHYETMRDMNKYSGGRISTKVFYGMFLERFDSVFNDVRNPKIKEVAILLRDKAVVLSDFDQHQPTHELAAKMVERLHELGMKLYAMPDMEYILESSKDMEISVFFTCCPEFTKEQDSMGCKGTVKTLSVPHDPDIQAAVRMYYEKFCKDCENRAGIEKYLADTNQ
nr:hypothetical protein [Candidatus Sigynarchaeota archaeon]